MTKTNRFWAALRQTLTIQLRDEPQPTERVEARLFVAGKLEPVGVTVEAPGSDGWWSYIVDAPIPSLGMVFLRIDRAG